MKILLWSLLGLMVVAVSALLYGSIAWQSATDTMHATLEAARQPLGPQTYRASELIGLPVPVQRYFRAALVAWMFPAGTRPYWRGGITSICMRSHNEWPMKHEEQPHERDGSYTDLSAAGGGSHYWAEE